MHSYILAITLHPGAEQEAYAMDAEHNRLAALFAPLMTPDEHVAANMLQEAYAMDAARAADTFIAARAIVAAYHQILIAVRRNAETEAHEMDVARDADVGMRARALLAASMELRKRYRIVRNYFRLPGRGRVIARGLTLQEAQAHCRNSETSSSTCTSSAGKRRTRTSGAWFDGYEEEK